MIKYSVFPHNSHEDAENYTHLYVIDAKIQDFSFGQSERQIEKLKVISSKVGSVLFAEKENTIYLSLGKYIESHSIENVFRSFFFKNDTFSEKKILIDLSLIQERYSETILLNSIKGIFLSTYKVADWRQEKPGEMEERTIQIKINVEEASLLSIIEQAGALAIAQMSIMRLVDAPSNFKTPQYIRDYCKNLAGKNGFEIQVIEGEDIRKEKLFALEAVGRGSEHPPLMLVMKYRSGKKDVPHLGLVGKGVTFDTGGISIKPSANLHMMKSDMGGAAAVIGAMDVVSGLRLEIDMTAVLPLTENCVDANAVKPGDVISSLAGKSIEIIDTDAEGRLILADGLFYLKKNFNPHYIIDIATLTGSTVRTFGYECAALFSNDDEFSELIREVGNESGERVWPLPMWKEYESGIKSDVADIANFSGKPINGAIDAALFLKEFIDEHEKWAHIDIAGVAFKASEYASNRSATGYGVNLLLNLAKKIGNL